MSQAEPPEVEVWYNFQPVNQYINHLLDRQRDLLSFRRFSRWKALLIGVGIVLISAGIAFLLYSWGLYIQKKDPQPEVVIREVPLPPSVSDAEERGANITVSYTIFQTVKLPLGASIVTGYKFDPTKPDFPERQYCYHESPGAAETTIKQLADKQGKAQVDWSNSVGSQMFELAQQNCAFRQ